MFPIVPFVGVMSYVGDHDVVVFDVGHGDAVDLVVESDFPALAGDGQTGAEYEHGLCVGLGVDGNVDSRDMMRRHVLQHRHWLRCRSCNRCRVIFCRWRKINHFRDDMNIVVGVGGDVVDAVRVAATLVILPVQLLWLIICYQTATAVFVD